MRTIPIQASRTLKIEDLKKQYQEDPVIVAALKLNPKLKEWPFGTQEGATADVAADLAEAISVENPGEVVPKAVIEFLLTSKGAAKVYETYLRQTKTDIQNTKAQAIVDEVTDPSKAKRSTAQAIKIAV